MKIFDRTDPWQTKVNFVDENNVVLGYDVRQVCCEHAGWFIADQPREWIPEPSDGKSEVTETLPDLAGWHFDPGWFKSPVASEYEGASGGLVIFRIVKGDDEKYIHLFNCHNGYYKHGFELKRGDALLKAGQL